MVGGKNQNDIADRLEQAKAAGKLGKGTVGRLPATVRSQSERPPTNRDDLHQALNSEEKARR